MFRRFWNIRVSSAIPRLALTAGMLLFQAGCSLIPNGASGISFLGKQQPTEAVDVAEGLARATRLHKSGDFLAAHDVVRRLIQRDPYSVEIRKLQAEIARDLGQRTQSARALQAAAVLEPNSAELQHEIGLKLIRLDARQAGLRALTKATTLAPREPIYAHDLAGTHLSGGNPQMAQAVLLEAYRHNPNDPSLPIALARLLESQEKWDRAAHYYTVAIKGNPGDLTWLRQRGRAWYRLKKYEAARRDLAACLDDFVVDEDWTTLREYGESCLKTGHTSAAQHVAALLDTGDADSNPPAPMLAAHVPKRNERQSSPAEIAPISKPPLLADNRAVRPRPMRDLTLVRYVESGRDFHQASLIRSPSAADGTRPGRADGPVLMIDQNAAKPPSQKTGDASTSTLRRSLAPQEGWKPHRRAG